MDANPTRSELTAETIDGAGVRLRRYREEDVADVQAGCDDPLTLRFLPQLPKPYTHADAEWWVVEGSGSAFANGGGNFVIADPATDRLVGGIGVTRYRDGNGEIGYWMAPWGRRRGFATAATRALTGYAFSAGYQRLQLRIEIENAASQRVAIGAGYQREGTQRSAAVTRDGGRYDLLIWSRLTTDPAGPGPRVLPDFPGGELTDGVVTVRPVGPADAADCHRLRVLPEVVASSVPPVAPDAAETAARCARAEAAWLAGQQARCAVRDVATGEYAGEVGLHYQEPSTGQALIGYQLLPEWRGRGYATRAVRLLTGWAFAATDIARLVAGTAPANTASQRVLTKAGFTREGYARGRLPGVDGGRIDDVTFALLRGDVRDSG